MSTIFILYISLYFYSLSQTKKNTFMKKCSLKKMKTSECSTNIDITFLRNTLWTVFFSKSSINICRMKQHEFKLKKKS